MASVNISRHSEIVRLQCDFRKMFENPEQAIIMFGGLQDAANLYASYDIRVECMVDLQGMLFRIL